MPILFLCAILACDENGIFVQLLTGTINYMY